MLQVSNETIFKNEIKLKVGSETFGGKKQNSYLTIFVLNK